VAEPELVKTADTTESQFRHGRRKTLIIPHLRWWIGGILFASTAINYIDRQTISVLAPYLKVEFHWTNSDFALILIAFRIAYALGQTASGRFLDRLGTRKGFLLTVSGYSLAAMLTSLAVGLRSFALFRFFVGAGESANWPGAAKTVSEWFPKSERGWAVALYDSGSAVGGAIVPALVLWLYHSFGSWRPPFLITGCLGFLWVVGWKQLYRSPELHPNLAPEERDMILRAKRQEQLNEPRALRDDGSGQSISWRGLLQLPQTWGIILGRTITEPVWFFIMDWFAIYLVSKGFKLENSVAGFWIPYVAGDLGNFFGGGFSSYLIRRGWPVLRARKFVIILGSIGMVFLIPAVLTSKFSVIIALFAVSSFAFASWSTMLLSLPTDLYPSRTVATVSGMSGTGGGVGTIISTFSIGWVTDRYSFQPVLIAASLVPLLGTALVLLLVRNRRGVITRN
jgi:ACS family hexuronate transporter-like MFS transporter